MAQVSINAQQEQEKMQTPVKSPQVHHVSKETEVKKVTIGVETHSHIGTSPSSSFFERIVKATIATQTFAQLVPIEQLQEAQSMHKNTVAKLSDENSQLGTMVKNYE